MVSIAEFTLAASDFPLGKLFDDDPDATLELDRVVPNEDTVMPYFWVTDPDHEIDAVLTVFEALPQLRSVTLMDDLGERGLFRAEWDPEYLGIMRAIAEAELTVVSARGSNDGWVFELRAEGTDQFSAFQQYCDDHTIGVSLGRLSHLSEAETADDALTREQREALLAAYDAGYYDHDGEATQETIAAQLGISRQALSSRLRRGYRNLIERTLHNGS